MKEREEIKGGETKLMDRRIRQTFCFQDFSNKMAYARKKANTVEINADRKELSMLFHSAVLYCFRTESKTTKGFSPSKAWRNREETG